MRLGRGERTVLWELLDAFGVSVRSLKVFTRCAQDVPKFLLPKEEFVITECITRFTVSVTLFRLNVSLESDNV